MPSIRTTASLAFVLAVLLGGGVIVGAISEWPRSLVPLRGLGLGFLVGTFGAATFWAGILVAHDRLPGKRSEDPARQDEERAKNIGVGPLEAKHWLQKFLEEQQHRGT